MANVKRRFCILSSISIACASCFASAMENGEIKEGDKIREENEQGSSYHFRELKHHDVEFSGKKRNRSLQSVKVSKQNKKRGTYGHRISKYQKVKFSQFMEALNIKVHRIKKDEQIFKNVNDINDRFSYFTNSNKRGELYFNDIMDLLHRIAKRLEYYKKSKPKSTISKHYGKFRNVKRIFDTLRFDVENFSAAYRDSLLRNLGITFEFEHQLACYTLYNIIPQQHGGSYNESFILERIKTINGLNKDEDAKEFFENMKKSIEEFIKNEEKYLKNISKKFHKFIDETVLSPNTDN